LTAEIDADLAKLEKESKKEKKAPKERKTKKDSFEFKAPKINMPDFHLPSFKVPKYEGEVETPKIDLEAEIPGVQIGQEIKEQEVPKVEVEIETKEPEVEIDFNSPEYKDGFKGFFKGLGGKMGEADVNIEEVNVKLPEIEEPRVEVEVKPSKVKQPKYDRKYELTINVDPSVRVSEADDHIASPSNEIDIDINSPEYKSGVKGFFKGINHRLSIFILNK
jgi:hypothetical protein